MRNTPRCVAPTRRRIPHSATSTRQGKNWPTLDPAGPPSAVKLCVAATVSPTPLPAMPEHTMSGLTTMELALLRSEQ